MSATSATELTGTTALEIGPIAKHGGLQADIKQPNRRVPVTAAAHAAAAALFGRELIDSVETFREIATEHGLRTLTDLMYMQHAVLTGGFIDAWQEDSAVVAVLKGLPSSDLWMQYVSVYDASGDLVMEAPSMEGSGGAMVVASGWHDSPADANRDRTIGRLAQLVIDVEARTEAEPAALGYVLAFPGTTEAEGDELAMTLRTGGSAVVRVPTLIANDVLTMLADNMGDNEPSGPEL